MKLRKLVEPKTFQFTNFEILRKRWLTQEGDEYCLQNDEPLEPLGYYLVDDGFELKVKDTTLKFVETRYQVLLSSNK